MWYLIYLLVCVFLSLFIGAAMYANWNRIKLYFYIYLYVYPVFAWVMIKVAFRWLFKIKPNKQNESTQS